MPPQVFRGKVEHILAVMKRWGYLVAYDYSAIGLMLEIQAVERFSEPVLDN